MSSSTLSRSSNCGRTRSKFGFYGLLLVAGLLTTACGMFWRFPQFFQSLPASLGGDESVSNGERIYFTATNVDGDWVRYSGGPRFGGMMMGSYLTCAACHGPEGRGAYQRLWWLTGWSDPTCHKALKNKYNSMACAARAKRREKGVRKKKRKREGVRVPRKEEVAEEIPCHSLMPGSGAS